MIVSAVAELGAAFARQFAKDGFHQIGAFNINDVGSHRTFVYDVNEPSANDWLFSIYAYVSFAEGGKAIRIGKSERKLSSRLRSYAYHIGGAVKDRVAKNEQFKGSTPPWEREGWLGYTLPYGGGLIFAQMIQPLTSDEETKQALRFQESGLIFKYDPPLCNDSLSGKRLKHDWIAEHGRPTTRRKRDLPSTVDES